MALALWRAGLGAVAVVRLGGRCRLTGRGLTHSPQQLRALLERHGLEPAARSARTSSSIPTRCAASPGSPVQPGDPVIEIGPGLGSLTLALVERGVDLTVIEADRSLVPVLHEILDPLAVRVVEADARTVDWDEVLAAHPGGRWSRTCPTTSRRRWSSTCSGGSLDRLDAGDGPARGGRRLAAGAGDAAVGIPSMVVAYFGRAEVVAAVPRTVFHPRPRVDSVLVRIERHAVAPVSSPFHAIEPLLRAAYGQRRRCCADRSPIESTPPVRRG
ncbi:MAG: rRNA adenine N-6-methyltransferase family protein [Acidimicrobiales bacterium]